MYCTLVGVFAGCGSEDGCALAAMVASEELEAVENLLESYFVQIDSTFDKVEAIGAPLIGILD